MSIGNLKTKRYSKNTEALTRSFIIFQIHSLKEHRDIKDING